MEPKKTLSASLVEEVNGLGIVRCEEKKVNSDGTVYGHTRTWYDVCLENGEGDIIQSFKTIREARKYAKEA